MISRTISLCALGVLALAGLARAQAPADIVWTTNNDDPPIGSPDALRGGTYRDYIGAYPLTFRLHGPNSNDAFAGWNRSFGINFTLVMQHPTTDNYIPSLATHWSIQDDKKTIYYKLDPDARWSDGRPITADDYIFAFEFLQTKEFPLPFYNRQMEDYFESVEKLDDYTIKIVGKQETWRPLYDYNFYPLPRHDIKIDSEWPVRDNYKPPVVPGPYVISDFREGERVEFQRLDTWWGEGKHYFQGMYNVDRIALKVITERDRAFDYFKKGELSQLGIYTSRTWATEMGFEAIEMGWVHRKQEYIEMPQGMYGMVMNLNVPIFQNKDFRKALQYLVNYDQLNGELMFNAYYRIVSAFEGTEYENNDLKPYGFDPRKAREHLLKAGFTKRGNDGILVDARANRASFSLIYGSKGLERHLTVVKNIFQRAGVEMRLQLLEAATAFEKGLEKAFEMLLFSRTAGFYPDPHQYFSTDFVEPKQNNNVWSYGSERVDKLIDIYRYDLDKDKRIAATAEIDAIIQDEAFYIPFWHGPYLRFLYWDYVEFPDSFYPKRTEQPMDYQVFWINPEKQKRLEEAMRNGTSLGKDIVIEVDPYGLKDSLPPIGE